MGRARHVRPGSRWAGVGLAVVLLVLAGGVAFAAIRLTDGGSNAAAPTTAPPPASTAPGATTAGSPSVGPTTEPSPSVEPTTGPSPSVVPTNGPSTTPPEPTASPTGTSPPPTGPPQHFHPLRPGMSGPDVLALQRRLGELGYWLNDPDGSYGDNTTQAVLAFQGYEGLAADGIAGPMTQAAMVDAERPAPRDPATDGVEIDKEHQVILVVRDGATKYVFHTSTGTGRPYVDPDGKDQIADTPNGHFTFTRQYDGWRDGDLGMLYRPKYFHPTGVAIHGYSNVPGYPASHGCARVSFAAMNFIWDQDLAPLRGPVWVY